MIDLRDRVRSVLGGRYRIDGEIGSGGMAIVYRAQDLKLGHPVAIKVLRPEVAAMMGTDRFLQEIEIASGLTHPHVVTIFDSGDADGLLYCVMPFIEGESLRARLARETRIPVADAVRIAAQAADALAFAHGKGVIHRDVKPENILLTAGHAMVSDFGVARAVHAAGGPNLTQTGLVVGTPAYMSPEQVMGASLDERTDVFSLGCVAYEMLAGRAAFDGFHRRSATPLRTLRGDLPEDVERAVHRSIALDPADRYASAKELAEALGGTSATAVVSRPRLRAWHAVGVAAVGLAVAVVGYFIWPRPPKVAAIAVLPLANVSGDPAQDYFADALTGELIRELSSRGKWRVISRTSVLPYRNGSKPPRQIARELNVDAILEGTVQRIGDRVRIGAQLVDARSETGLWSRSYTRQIEDIVDLESDVASAISGEIGASRAVARRRRVDPKAYDAYLRGRFRWEERTPDGLQAAIRYFELSVSLDSTYAPAYAGLADSYSMLWLHGLLSPQESYARARAAAEKAIALDDGDAQAHASLAVICSDYFWEWTRARREFLRAIELDPNYATAHKWYSEFLAKMGDLPAATNEIARARELDPLSPAIEGHVATTEYFARRYDRALAAFARSIAMDPESWLTRVYHGLALAAVERYPEAVQEMEAARKISPNNSLPIAGLGYVCARAGDAAQARAILAQLQASPLVPRSHLALIHVGLGENAQAIDELEKAAAQHDVLVSYLAVQPVLDPLRDEPRFRELLARIGLTPRI